MTSAGTPRGLLQHLASSYFRLLFVGLVVVVARFALGICSFRY